MSRGEGTVGDNTDRTPAHAAYSLLGERAAEQVPTQLDTEAQSVVGV